MTATQLRRASFALVAWAFGLSLAAAQEKPPIVDSEIIGSAPFRSNSKALAGSDLEKPPSSTCPTSSVTTVAPSAAMEAVNSSVMTRAIASDPRETPDESNGLLALGSRAQRDASQMSTTERPWLALAGPLAGAWFAATSPESRMSSQMPLPANDLPIAKDDASTHPLDASCTPTETESPAAAVAQPAPLSPTDSKMFAPSTSRSLTEGGAGHSDSLSQHSSASTPRMPRMTKMFSFDTIDKVAPSPVAPALGHFSPELTLDLDGPETVAVNQVFQQMVQIRNSSSLPLRDIRVTQVCNLRVLGADRHQAVTIDVLEPGETKTVRFSARARQAGSFAVRYVAESSHVQADIDELVQVSDANASD